MADGPGGCSCDKTRHDDSNSPRQGAMHTIPELNHLVVRGCSPALPNAARHLSRVHWVRPELLGDQVFDMDGRKSAPAGGLSRAPRGSAGRRNAPPGALPEIRTAEEADCSGESGRYKPLPVRASTFCIAARRRCSLARGVCRLLGDRRDEALAYLGRRQLKLVRHTKGITFYHTGPSPEIPPAGAQLTLENGKAAPARGSVDDLIISWPLPLGERPHCSAGYGRSATTGLSCSAVRRSPAPHRAGASR